MIWCYLYGKQQVSESTEAARQWISSYLIKWLYRNNPSLSCYLPEIRQSLRTQPVRPILTSVVNTSTNSWLSILWAATAGWASPGATLHSIFEYSEIRKKLKHEHELLPTFWRITQCDKFISSYKIHFHLPCSIRCPFHLLANPQLPGTPWPLRPFIATRTYRCSLSGHPLNQRTSK